MSSDQLDSSTTSEVAQSPVPTVNAETEGDGTWRFNDTDRISQVQVFDEGKKVTSGMVGFRTCRATRGVREGKHSFSVRIVELRKGKPADAHVRVGWVPANANLNTPVGYESTSYGFRDIDGSKVCDAWRSPLGPSFGENQIVRCVINLPKHPEELNPGEDTTSSQDGTKPGEDTTSSQDGTKPTRIIPQSYCEFFVDGKSCGKAFTDLADPGEEGYFPAVSLYYGAVVELVD